MHGAVPEDLAALEDALGCYAALFDGSVERTGWTSFQAKFQSIKLVYRKAIWPNTMEGEASLSSPTHCMTICRDAVELYGLLLILHRHTNKNFLYANRRLRVNCCAREEILPRVQLKFYLDENSDRSETLDDWRALLASGQCRSKAFYAAREKILELYEVNEAFVQDKTIELALVFSIQNVQDSATREEVVALPERVVQLYKAIQAEDNQLRIRFVDAQISCGTALAMTASMEAKMPASKKSLTMDSQWTRQDGLNMVHAANRACIEHVYLKVHSAREMMIALEVYASLTHTEILVIIMEIGKDWRQNIATLDDVLSLEMSSALPQRLVLHTGVSPDNMNELVDAVLLVFNSINQQIRDKVCECPSISLRTRVNERDKSDLSVIGPLLDVIGTRIDSLEMDSYSPIEDFDEQAYVVSPESFDLRPILTACPNLRLLAVQAASLETLPELFERGETKLEALRVQRPPAASTVVLIESLGDTSTKISNYLVEFSTLRNEVELQAACLETLKRRTHLRYLRLGREDPSCDKDSLSSELIAHHSERLSLHPGTLCLLINQIADTLAMTTRDRLEADVLRLIEQFVGPTVYRQVKLW